MKNIILIHPKVGEMDIFRDKPTPPLSLIYASTLLTKQYEILIIDQRTDINWKEKIKSAISSTTIAFGITTMTGEMIKYAIDIAKYIRKLSDKPIIWGGIHPSLTPQQTLESNLCDYVIKGDGELSLLKLLECIEKGHMPDIPGIYYKRKNQIIKNEPHLINLETLPLPPYFLVDMSKYEQTYCGEKMLFYQSSRGCPYYCSYCYNTAFNGNKIRYKSAEKVIKEIIELKEKLKFSLVYFLDDNFFINTKRAKIIISELSKMGIGTVLQGVDINSIDKMSDEDIDFMEKNRVIRITIGVESATNRIRKHILNKQLNFEVVKKNLKRFIGKKIIIFCSFIIGLPTETEEEIENTIKFAFEILSWGDNFRMPQLYIFQPYPETAIFKKHMEQNKIPKSLIEWAEFNFDKQNFNQKYKNIENIVFLSKFLDRKIDDYQTLNKLLKYIYNLYSPIAKFRIKNKLTKFLIEKILYEKFKKILL